jgi:hypothetical protein
MHRCAARIVGARAQRVVHGALGVLPATIELSPAAVMQLGR